jgi:hypothetical protein
MIIGLSGYAKSGKDTVAQFIQELTSPVIEDYGHFKRGEWVPMRGSSPWVIKKFSAKLKQIASMFLGIPAEDFEKHDVKDMYLGPEWDLDTTDAAYFGLPGARFLEPDEYYRPDGRVYKRMTVREFLQKLGTEGVRFGLHPNAWVNALMADYKPAPHYHAHYDSIPEQKEPDWLITDTRFPNEAQAIKDRGGIIIRVDRPGVQPTNGHSSETALDNWPFDYRIANVSDLESLKFTTETIMRQLNILK